MQALMTAMMVWIAGVSGLPVPESPPKVVQLSPRELAERISPDGAYDPAMARRYLALYHADSGTILLREDWDPGTLRDRSVLLHELVHHMQASAGRRYPCRGARERAAYEIQAQWLERHGRELSGTLGLNALFLHALTRC